MLLSIAHSIICTRLFRGKMHSDWFNEIEVLEGRWQHGEKVGYCYPSGLEKTLCKWDLYVPLVTKGLKLLIKATEMRSFIYKRYENKHRDTINFNNISSASSYLKVSYFFLHLSFHNSPPIKSQFHFSIEISC